jgi:recombination protein RecT
MSTPQQVIERPQQQATHSVVALFRERLIERRGEMEVLCQQHGYAADLVIRQAVTALTVNEDLQKCTWPSFWIAVLQSCSDGVKPDGREGAIVALGNRAAWWPMTWGKVHRIQQHPDFKWLNADFHRTDDKAYDIWTDETGQHFLHRPGLRKGAILSTYAAALMKSGAFYVAELSEDDMARRRAMSRGRRDDAPWNKWPEEMRKTKALKAVCKLLPLPPALYDLVQRADPDEDESIASPAHQDTLQRPRGADQALEHFAGDAVDTPEPEPREPVLEHEASATENTALGDTAQQTETSDAPAEGPRVAPVLLETAHERGKAARAEGAQRRAIPPEYRDPARGQEAIAWRKGWDGEALGAVS